MNETKGCARCAQRRAAAQQSRAVPARQTVVQEEFLWFEDRITDDPVPQHDPQSGDVTDGSVDYYDFEWGEAVVYDEASMEPPLFPCGLFCGAGSCGSSGQDSGSCGCTQTDPCADTDGCAVNSPEQQDEPGYLILPE